MRDVINGFYGLPGSGKTTVMAACATASLNGKYFLNVPPKERVFSNVPIPGTYQLTFEMIGRDDLSHSLLLIDEACQWFDSRSWKSFPKEVSAFFQTIRHEHSSVCMFYQAFNDVDIRLRSICQSHFLLSSLPFDLTLIKPVEHVQDIYNYKPDDRYRYARWYYWRIIRRSKYYHLFDSYIRFQTYKKTKLLAYPGENNLVKSRTNFRDLFKKKSPDFEEFPDIQPVENDAGLVIDSDVDTVDIDVEKPSKRFFTAKALDNEQVP